jgi:hypothetical protein
MCDASKPAAPAEQHMLSQMLSKSCRREEQQHNARDELAVHMWAAAPSSMGTAALSQCSPVFSSCAISNMGVDMTRNIPKEVYISRLINTTKK